MRLLRRLFALSVLLVALILVAPHTTTTAQAPQPVDPPQRVYPPEATYSIPQTTNLIEGLSHHESQIQTTPNSWPWTIAVSEVYDLEKDQWDIYRWVGHETYFSLEMLTDDSVVEIDPSIQSVTGDVLYASRPDGNYDIFHWNNGNPRRLTNHASDDSEPAWSPDGSHIAFVSERDGNEEIYLMNRDGSGQKRLTSSTHSDFSPAWSPNGKNLIWVRAIDGDHGAIMRMNIDGSNQITIMSGLRYVENVDYSPNGSQIGFDYDANEDGWLDWGVFNISDGIVETWRFGTFENSSGESHGQDYVFGSWMTNDLVMGNIVRYVYYQGEWYIESTFAYGSDKIGAYFIGGVTRDTFFPFNFDTSQIDPVPPSSHVFPLPEFTLYSGTGIIETRDNGPSGLCEIVLQEREGDSGGWEITYPYYNSPYTAFGYSSSPGITKYYRTVARDCAANEEPTPETHDAMTHFYACLLEGQVLDNREAPIFDTQVDVFSTGYTRPVWVEPNTDELGKFTRHINWNNYTITLNHPQYNSLPSKSLPCSTTYNWYLPPADDLILNGGFETGTDWILSGSQPPHILGSAANTGSHGLKLGDIIVTGPFDTLSATRGDGAEIALDKSGRIVLAWAQNGKIYYSRKSDGEPWPIPTQLDIDNSYSRCPSMAETENGNVYISWLDHQSGALSDSIQITGITGEGSVEGLSSPSGPFIVPNDYAPMDSCPELVADSTGGFHMVWFGKNLAGTTALWYTTRPSGGSWSTPEAISDVSSVHTLIIDRFDHLYAVVGSGNQDVLRHRENGVWNTGIAIPGSEWTNEFSVDSTGRIYVIEGSGSAINLWNLGFGDNSWTGPIDLKSPNTSGDPVYLNIDTDDRIYALFGNYNTTYYRLFTPGQGWSSSAVLNIGYDNPQAYNRDFTVDDLGRLIYIDYVGSPNILGVRSAIFPESFDAIASQTISIPSDMYKPTLSFMYKQTGGTGDELMHVLINGIEILTNSITTADWTHKWIDMTSYAGRDVTLDFRLEVPDSHKDVSLLLDEVSLGSWKTPWLKAVSPGRILSGWTGKTLTIDLENYVAGSTLFLDDTALTNVQVVDADTVTAVIPAGLPAGGYHLRVETPDGRQSELPQDVYLGTSTFISFITKE